MGRYRMSVKVERDGRMFLVNGLYEPPVTGAREAGGQQLEPDEPATFTIEGIRDERGLLCTSLFGPSQQQWFAQQVLRQFER